MKSQKLLDPFSFANPDNPFINPFHRNPKQSNFHRRANHHDYTRPAKYLITILKNPSTPPFSRIEGNPHSQDPGGIKVTFTPVGKCVHKALEDWKTLYPIFVPSIVIMPDHIHLCLHVISELKKGDFGRMISRLTGKVTSYHRQYLQENNQPIPEEGVFSPGFNDRIAFTEQQWQTQQRYVRDNPRRYLFKRLFPDYLRTRWLLSMSEDRKFILLGNIFLLRQPHLFRVKTSRHFSTSEAAAATFQWHKEAYNGSIPISPFIHPHERELREWAVNEGFSYIRVCTNGFTERGAASGQEFELMMQGRVLLIGQPEYNGRKENLRYEFASSLNALAEEIANSCNMGQSLTIRRL